MNGLIKRKSIFYAVFMLTLVFMLAACGGEQTAPQGTSSNAVSPSENTDVKEAEDVIEWDMSLWGGPREVTYPVEDWAKDMFEQTDGRWKITLHYGEAISPAVDNLDGISSGLFEASLLAPFYTPGVLPLNQVMDLPFIAPLDTEELSLFQKAAWEHPAIRAELEQYNAIPLLHSIPPQYEYMGTKRIEKAEDFAGVRISGMSADIGRAFEKFGAVPTPMPAPELYSSLDRGTIDGAIFPMSYGYGAYKLYEVSQYTTVGIASGSPASFYIANKDAWNALPDDIKEIHNKYMEDWHVKNAAPHKVADEKYIPIFKEETEYIEFPTEEREKLMEASQDVWDEWVQKYADRGPTQEILDYMLEKRKEISGF